VEVVSSSSEGAAPAPLWWCQEPSAKNLGRETGAGPGFKVWIFKIFQSEKKLATKVLIVAHNYPS
jgi:hypothetical protein